ncbi:NADH:flavin oxidoreductase [Natronomonas sp. F2-12]|uniref:NADH:flavin oxidoreductase n=1 Tax=Natronomonas aquatica TaxID=2841590 RepID=A0A9R1CQ57_9EURY|nr:NADH:flavin oxidoreductase [Natronomonas aquatica]MCQ4332042.1 NADH:flavin oxidoreductase [Natronomonas aquatica]
MLGPQLESSVTVGGRPIRNRLYRAPLLECAGNGPEAVETLIDELEPAAASGAGLIHQGATIVREAGGCAAPGMTRVADSGFVERLEELTEAVHAHGSAIAIQLEYGGLRSMEVWHAGYRRSNPGLEQLVVSRPPWILRSLDRVGFLDLNPRVMDTDEVEALAADFGRAAARAVEAGYDMIHLAGANMGIIQQFLSPFYNRREDEFGIDPEVGSGVRFLERVHEEIRDRAGDVPLITKVPSEAAAPAPLQPRLSDADAIRTAARLDSIGYDGVVPVRCSVFWDMSIVRGAFPARAWRDPTLKEGYREAFGSRTRATAVAAGNWLQSRRYDREPGWNADLARRVRSRVDIPVFLEGGLRERAELDSYLGDAADLVGMGRPFYAEPRLPARLLDGPADTRAVCEDCNNCAVAQAAGASGNCRTPSVLEEAGALRKRGAYDRTGNERDDGDPTE